MCLVEPTYNGTETYYIPFRNMEWYGVNLPNIVCISLFKFITKWQNYWICLLMINIIIPFPSTAAADAAFPLSNEDDCLRTLNCFGVHVNVIMSLFVIRCPAIAKVCLIKNRKNLFLSAASINKLSIIRLNTHISNNNMVREGVLPPAESGEFIAKNAQHVKIHEAGLEKLCEEVR